jgi:diphosphomevalonate decarboxylase
VITAIAHPNIALAKYWGKLPRPGNFPAVPSLSVTLAAMTTTTHVEVDRKLAMDEVTLNGRTASPEDQARVSTLLDRIRAAAGVDLRARVVSTNDFPTASGLASSASGFAALALAATHAMGLDWADDRVSDLARRGSASAARSIFGGWVELCAGAEHGDDGDVLTARAIAPAEALDARVLVCVVTEDRKDASSRDGMLRTAERSPYYAHWLDLAPRLFEQMKRALAARDTKRLFELAEESALAMHACAMGAGVIYLRDVSREVMARVGELRKRDLVAYATSDAGPHVKVLCSTNDAPVVRGSLASIPGVLRVIESGVGGGARLA